MKWTKSPIYRFHDGESFVTIHLLGNTDKYITCVVCKDGKMSYTNFDKRESKNGNYFEYTYGAEYKNIYLNDFEEDD